MIKLFTKNPYQHVINFIDAAVYSEELSSWLESLERESDNMRIVHLAEIKHQMTHNNEPKQHLEIIELMSNKEILVAMNRVIREVNESGLKAKKFIKKKDNTNYSILISLIAAS